MEAEVAQYLEKTMAFFSQAMEQFATIDTVNQLNLFTFQLDGEEIQYINTCREEILSGLKSLIEGVWYSTLMTIDNF